MEIQLKLTVVGIDTPEKVAALQARLEEVVRLLPHFYEVFQDSGGNQKILDTIVASHVETKIEKTHNDESN